MPDASECCSRRERWFSLFASLPSPSLTRNNTLALPRSVQRHYTALSEMQMDGLGLIRLVLKHLLHRHLKNRRDAKSDLQGGRIFAVLDGIHRLASDADLIREFLLGHLSMMETKGSDSIPNRRVGLTHCYTPRR